MSCEELKEKQPDELEQLSFLEGTTADFADKGYDVKEASIILDNMKAKLETKKPGDNIGLNESLNQVRTTLHNAPIRFEFSCSYKPYIIILYELAFLGFWIWLGAIHLSGLNTSMQVEKWTWMQTIYLCAIAGSIGAISFTLHGIYTHMIHRSMDPTFTSWYLIRPIVGVVMGSFIGLVTTVILNGINATGDTAKIFTFAAAFLAGANERFAAEMISRFTSKIMGVGDKSEHQNK
ncbi:hypothetical protein RCG17_22900 [Neobacillus sp. PS3-12]|uniref:hypothetical protein n=1 Tax=Neobacillus sp. PS3-12 TaxID=3070677 RepID=UPI0027E03E09|nr:hypothetical protein [Neobacillus sp. PS3-12]WML52209.1 hypothetical protein RCG17_22900 [Neobacillus sp. PS3-12]